MIRGNTKTPDGFEFFAGKTVVPEASLPKPQPKAVFATSAVHHSPSIQAAKLPAGARRSAITAAKSSARLLRTAIPTRRTSRQRRRPRPPRVISNTGAAPAAASITRMLRQRKRLLRQTPKQRSWPTTANPRSREITAAIPPMKHPWDFYFNPTQTFRKIFINSTLTSMLSERLTSR